MELDKNIYMSYREDGNGYTLIECDPFATKIEIPNEVNGKPVVAINGNAFERCHLLETVTIPANLNYVEVAAFDTCYSLVNITVDSNNRTYASIDGNLYAKGLPTLICYCIGKPETNFTVPSGIAKIGDFAFSNSAKLKSITIPETVTVIGEGAFSDCDALTSITIPNSVTKIGDYVFSWCKLLTSVTIPTSVTEIGNYVFYKCEGLTSVTIPSSVTKIGNGTFRGCNGSIMITSPLRLIVHFL